MGLQDLGLCQRDGNPLIPSFWEWLHIPRRPYWSVQYYSAQSTVLFREDSAACSVRNIVGCREYSAACPVYPSPSAPLPGAAASPPRSSPQAGRSPRCAGCARCQRTAPEGGPPPSQWRCRTGRRPSGRGRASSTTSAGARGRGVRHRGVHWPLRGATPPPVRAARARWRACSGGLPPADPDPPKSPSPM